MSSWRTLILNERGVALPLALICLVALTVMVLTFLTLSGVEPQISQNLTESTRARYMAESGIEWAFKQIAARPAGLAPGSFEPALFAGPDNIQNTADDQQPTNVTAQNHAAMLTVLNSPSPLPTKTTTEGTYSVTVRNDNLAGDDKFNGLGAVDGGNKFTDTNGIVIVTSTGNYRGATRTIQVALKRIGIPPFPGAVNIPGFQADTFLSNSVNAGNANRYDIDGRDYNRDGTSGPGGIKLGVQVQPGTQVDLGITYEARAEQPFDKSDVCTGADCSAATQAANRTARLGIVKGKHQTSGAYTTGLNTIGPDGSLTPAVMNTFLQQIASNPATTILQSTQACPIVMTGGASTATNTPTLTNSCSMNQPVNLGTTSDPKMVYFRGDPDTSSTFAGVTLNNMVSGAGILIIEDGDFQQYGNLRWDGLVIVTGQYVSAAFRAGSNTTIYGALTGMESQPTESSGLFDFFIDQNLDLRIRSSKQNLDMVQQMLSVHKILSWREN